MEARGVFTTESQGFTLGWAPAALQAAHVEHDRVKGFNSGLCNTEDLGTPSRPGGLKGRRNKAPGATRGFPLPRTPLAA